MKLSCYCVGSKKEPTMVVSLFLLSQHTDDDGHLVGSRVVCMVTHTRNVAKNEPPKSKRVSENGARFGRFRRTWISTGFYATRLSVHECQWHAFVIRGPSRTNGVVLGFLTEERAKCFTFVNRL